MLNKSDFLCQISGVDRPKIQHHSRSHSRSLSEEARLLKQNGGEMDALYHHTESVRTDSPDNDSAFSDTVSMLSSESSTSSGGSAGSKLQPMHLTGQSQQVM